jgi:hypothetical protein
MYLFEPSGSVDGAMTEVGGLRNSDQKPNRNRSIGERLGARCRERSMIRSCCFINRLSATTDFAPPGPRNLAMVVNRWAISISRSIMVKQSRRVRRQQQVCPSCRFWAKIANSPYTGVCRIVQTVNVSVNTSLPNSSCNVRQYAVRY